MLEPLLKSAASLLGPVDLVDDLTFSDKAQVARLRVTEGATVVAKRPVDPAALGRELQALWVLPEAVRPGLVAAGDGVAGDPRCRCPRRGPARAAVASQDLRCRSGLARTLGQPDRGLRRVREDAIMNRSRIAAASAAVLLVFASAACGDDDALSASEYRSQGNTICRDVGAGVRAAVPDEQPTVEAIQRDHAPALAGALSSLRDRLGELRPPANLAGGHAQLVSAVDSALATSEQAARDVVVASRLREEGPPLEEIGERATALGLTSCAG